MPRRRPRRAATRRPGGSDLPRALTRAGLRPGALQPSTWSTWQIRGAILIFRRWEAMKWDVEATRYVVIDDGAYVYPVLREDLGPDDTPRSEEHTSELQSRPHLVCRLLLEKK